MKERKIINAKSKELAPRQYLKVHFDASRLKI